MIPTDTSDLTKGAVLNQSEPDGNWQSVTLYNKKFSHCEFNYDIHDKEMVLIVDCFKEWRHDLIGQRVVVYTDQENLDYFHTTNILNCRRAQWTEVLTEFDVVIAYRPGYKNGTADTLSHRPDPELGEGSEPQISMFKPRQLGQI